MLDVYMYFSSKHSLNTFCVSQPKKKKKKRKEKKRKRNAKKQSNENEECL